MKYSIDFEKAKNHTDLKELIENVIQLSLSKEITHEQTKSLTALLTLYSKELDKSNNEKLAISFFNTDFSNVL